MSYVQPHMRSNQIYDVWMDFQDLLKSGMNPKNEILSDVVLTVDFECDCFYNNKDDSTHKTTATNTRTDNYEHMCIHGGLGSKTYHMWSGCIFRSTFFINMAKYNGTKCSTYQNNNSSPLISGISGSSKHNKLYHFSLKESCQFHDAFDLFINMISSVNMKEDIEIFFNIMSNKENDMVRFGDYEIRYEECVSLFPYIFILSDKYNFMLTEKLCKLFLVSLIMWNPDYSEGIVHLKQQDYSSDHLNTKYKEEKRVSDEKSDSLEITKKKCITMSTYGKFYLNQHLIKRECNSIRTWHTEVKHDSSSCVFCDSLNNSTTTKHNSSLIKSKVNNNNNTQYDIKKTNDSFWDMIQIAKFYGCIQSMIDIIKNTKDVRDSSEDDGTPQILAERDYDVRIYTENVPQYKYDLCRYGLLFNLRKNCRIMSPWIPLDNINLNTKYTCYLIISITHDQTKECVHISPSILIRRTTRYFDEHDEEDLSSSSLNLFDKKEIKKLCIEFTFYSKLFGVISSPRTEIDMPSSQNMRENNTTDSYLHNGYLNNAFSINTITVKGDLFNRNRHESTETNNLDKRGTASNCIIEKLADMHQCKHKRMSNDHSRQKNRDSLDRSNSSSSLSQSEENNSSADDVAMSQPTEDMEIGQDESDDTEETENDDHKIIVDFTSTWH